LNFKGKIELQVETVTGEMANSRVRDEMARRANAWTAPDAAPGTAPHGGVPRSSAAQAVASEATALVLSTGVSDGLRPLSSSAGLGATTMEGPLPAEARSIIHTACSGEAAEQAEVYARRLLSTHRRVRVYREELQFASEEVDDIKQVAQKNLLVCEALQREMTSIDEKINALMSERQMCQLQLDQEKKVMQRNEAKKDEAQRRVELLRSTIDNIARETQKGHMLLRQLVPNLQIENYCS
jgi:hypothetical protein